MTDEQRLKMLEAAYTLLHMALPECHNKDTATNHVYGEIYRLKGGK